MKTLEFIYQENEIHFCINGNDKDVMINATEMAKVFGKSVKHFTRSEHAKAFIKILERDPNGSRSDKKVMDNRGHMGMYFNRILALKFAAWLDPEFEVWVFSKIEEITFGEYKKHWEAHARQIEAKQKMKDLKERLLLNPDKEVALQYFEAENEFNSAAYDKTKAIRNQLRLFDSN